ncbi:MAG: hypothetical protein QOH43_3557 [Solirubrobacteraceae bacterium]|nr:hypothetical protein [Solirubrobacteraceae bacterium]
MPTRRVLGLLLGGSLFLSAAVPAASLAAPVTVNLRVEGPTRTLFEGPVTTDVAPFKFSDSAQTYTCDGTAALGGPSATPVPTRGTLLSAAAAQNGFELKGGFSSFGASFSRINGEDVGFDAATNKYLVEYHDGSFDASYGACARPVVTGDDEVFAYGDGSESLLKLSRTAGPAIGAPNLGATLTLKVTDAGTGEPVAGAAVAGQTTGADGTVTVGPLTTRGVTEFKATKAGAIRSNADRVCVTDGADGACGTTTPSAPTPPAACVTSGDDGLCGTTDKRPATGSIASLKNGQTFAKGKGPRTLKGTVAADPSGLGSIRLRLSRNDRGTCTAFSGTTERFTKLKRCSTLTAKFFTIPAAPSWSYQLPSKLGRGRYVLDVVAVDKAGNADSTLVRGRNRVVFRVG